MPFMGKLSLINSRILPGSTETCLSNVDTFHSSIESDRITVIKQISSDSTSLVDENQELRKLPDNPVTSLIKQWDIDKFSTPQENVAVPKGNSNSPMKNMTNEQYFNESNSRQNSAQRNERMLEKQASIDETSTGSPRSRPDSQQLSDSGFVSPKNILPPIRPKSSVDRPPWILPPLTTRGKHSSQDSILEPYDTTNQSGTSPNNREDKSENDHEIQKSDSLQ
ncbi:hypothetical protein L9F63_009551 [Diploptera punctata]|uniref:Uncharacterized protein n=1 Tax=Diploptera punctata TaxID=6984 RepID=A0AAD8AJE7_DIPPU|nr:hypothetical protein L9F63_009551 [Diploptera punctata]